MAFKENLIWLFLSFTLAATPLTAAEPEHFFKNGEASEALKLRYDESAPKPRDTGHGFTGHFLSAVGSERFTLNLSQQGDTLTGFHAVSVQKGDKTDGAGSGSLPSIQGTVSGPVVVVRFRGGIPGSYAWGHARLTLRDRYLYWQLIDAYGEHLLPQNAVLIRQ